MRGFNTFPDEIQMKHWLEMGQEESLEFEKELKS